MTATTDAARSEGDPEADACVAGLGDAVWAMNALLRGVKTSSDSVPVGVPATVRALVLPSLPAWADLVAIRRAQRFADEHVLAITVALFFASLPTSYASADGARVLVASGRMHEDIDRRVNETARFVLDVLRPNGFDAGGAALVSCGKVRFIHAGVRRMLAAEWKGSIPINQEDQLGTLLCFSVVVLQAIARLGIAVTPRQRDDFVHLWTVVGALLGVRDDLLPGDYREAERSLHHIARRQLRASEHGRALMASLADGYERHLGPVGGRPAALAMVRHLAGDHVANVLGVPVGNAPRLFAAGAQLLKPPLVDRWGATLMATVSRSKLEGRRVTFPVPTRRDR